MVAGRDKPTIKAADYNPDEYRMSVGEHLEELRRRLLWALGGFIVAVAVCLFFGQRVTAIFCQPLVSALLAKDLHPQVYITEVADAFLVYLRISLICAAAISAPWAVYQIWQFIAAGLYPYERAWVRRYTPLSIALLVAGMMFVYFAVLPWTLDFFLDFSSSIPLSTLGHPRPTTGPLATTQAAFVPHLNGDPAHPQAFQWWFNEAEGRLKMFYKGEVRVILFGPQNLTTPLITLPQYVNLVMGMLLLFGLSFQLPLLVMAAARLGLVEIPTLKSARRYVYLGMVVLAAVITPGDVLTATVALIVPLCLLYELGVWLAGRTAKSPSPPAAD